MPGKDLIGSIRMKEELCCVDKYNCKDWENREKIAKEVRKKKGMSDVFVTGGV